MTDSSTPRSVFGRIDQELILNSLDAVDDDGIDSDFFAGAVADDSWSADASPHVPQSSKARWLRSDGSIDLTALDADARAAFIVHGPGGLA